MTNKQRLVEYIKTNGQTHSWADLARMFALRTAEIARHTWRNHKKSVPLTRTVTKVVSGVTLPISLSPLDKQKEIILEEMKKHSPQVQKLPYTKSLGDKKRMLEISIFDLHIGKLCWAEETGEDYDIQIAVARYENALQQLLSTANLFDVEKILLPIGNDMLNVDNKFNTTTHGTPQCGDSRFNKMFKVAKTLLINTIERLSQYAPIDVVVIPGNHDEQTMFTLGEVLDAWFHLNPNIKVFNSSKLRKYYEYGTNLIMFTHGDKERFADLGMIMATEEPQAWGRTTCREVHMGHLHKSKVLASLSVDEHNGYKVRILPSLSGTDAWHSGKGYNSQKAAKAFLWDKEKGLVAEYTHTLTDIS